MAFAVFMDGVHRSRKEVQNSQIAQENYKLRNTIEALEISLRSARAKIVRNNRMSNKPQITRSLLSVESEYFNSV